MLPRKPPRRRTPQPIMPDQMIHKAVGRVQLIHQQPHMMRHAKIAMHRNHRGRRHRTPRRRQSLPQPRDIRRRRFKHIEESRIQCHRLFPWHRLPACAAFCRLSPSLQRCSLPIPFRQRTRPLPSPRRRPMLPPSAKRRIQIHKVHRRRVKPRRQRQPISTLNTPRHTPSVSTHSFRGPGASPGVERRTRQHSASDLCSYRSGFSRLARTRPTPPAHHAHRESNGACDKGQDRVLAVPASVPGTSV